MLAEMGVAIGVDGHTVGLFQPRRVSYEHSSSNMIQVLSLHFSKYQFSFTYRNGGCMNAVQFEVSSFQTITKGRVLHCCIGTSCMLV